MGYLKQRREDRCILIFGSQQIDLGGRGDHEQSSFQIPRNPEKSSEVFRDFHQSSGEIWIPIPGGFIYFLSFQGVSDSDGYREEKYIPIREADGGSFLWGSQ